MMPQTTSLDLFKNPRRSVVWAHIGFDSESVVCRDTAAALESMLRQVDPLLIQVLQPEAIGNGIRGLADWVAATGRVNRQKQQQATKLLGAEWNLRQEQCVDSDFCPQCVLLLPSESLTEGSAREELARALLTSKGMYSSYLVLLIDEDGAPLETGAEQEQLQDWLEPFRELSSVSWVRLYLISATLDSGHFVHRDQLVDALAIALSADLVIPDANDERILTNASNQGDVILGTIGLRALRYDCDGVVEKLAGRFSRDLLRRTVFETQPVSSVQLPDFLASVPDLLNENFPDNEFDAEPLMEEVGGAGEFRPGMPCLTGIRPNSFKCSVDLGAMTEGMSLESVPRRRWLEHMYQWDFFLRDNRLVGLLSGMSRRLNQVAVRQQDQANKAITSAFISNGADLGVETAKRIGDRAQQYYKVLIAEGDAPSLDKSLGKLHDALEQIPHGPSLAARTGLLLGMQAFLVWLAWTARLANLPSLSIALAIVGGLTVLSGIWSRWSTTSKAWRTAKETLEESQARAQRTYCLAIQQQIERMRQRHTAGAERQVETLTEVRAALRNLVNSADPKLSQTNGLVRSVPTADQMNEFYHGLYEQKLSEHGDGDLTLRFALFLKEQLEKAFAGNASATSIADGVVEFSQTELRRLCARFQLYHFLCNRIEDGDLDKELVKRSLEPLGRQFPFACLQGIEVRNRLLDPECYREYCIAPPMLEQFLPVDKHPLEAITSNCVALVARVELLNLSSDRFDEVRLPTGADEPYADDGVKDFAGADEQEDDSSAGVVGAKSEGVD